jgi:hypothetical protein
MAVMSLGSGLKLQKRDAIDSKKLTFNEIIRVCKRQFRREFFLPLHLAEIHKCASCFLLL